MTDSQPLVSVIIPTRNRKKMLLYAIKSVTNQNYDNTQIIIQDNNCQDGSREYIFSKIKDKRIEWHRSNIDLTMTENWNKAYHYVKGSYFIRLDDDNLFFHDLISSAIADIKKYKLDVVTYSPLIVWLNNRVSQYFPSSEHLFLFKTEHILFADYYNLTDTNYSLYKTKIVNKIFPDENIYQTTLPDRYLNYKIALNLKKMRLKVAFSTSIKALTRRDYRPELRPNACLKYASYRGLNDKEIMKKVDCHDNFSMHRVLTLKYFLSRIRNQEIKDYAAKQIINPNLYRALMQIGNVYMFPYIGSLKEAFPLIRYYLSITLQLIINHSSIMESKNMIANLYYLNINFLIMIYRSIKHIINKDNQDAVDTTFGESISRKISTQKNISFFKNKLSQKILIEFGDFETYLLKHNLSIIKIS